MMKSFVRLTICCLLSVFFFRGVCVAQVNGRRLHDPETVELQHLDRVVLGRSVCLGHSPHFGPI